MLRPTPKIHVPKLDDAILRHQPHQQWLDNFATSLQLGREKRGAPVTPFLQGAVTRLGWAAQYIGTLKADLYWLTRDNRRLRQQIELLGGIPPKPYKPEAERASDVVDVSSDPGEGSEAAATPPGDVGPTKETLQ